MKLSFSEKNHAYYLDGKRCKSVTQVAKIPDDTFTLNQYRERMIAIGMATRPDLVELAAAHYDDKGRLSDICAEAARAAGAHRKADRGTAAHRITERHDAGELIIETDFSRRVRDAWQQAMEDAGLEVACDSQGRPLQERVVVWPEQLVCGKFDRVALRRSTGKLTGVDLKTGDGAIKYPHSIAIQLGLYVCAPLLAGPLPVGGGSTEEFERMADLGEWDFDTALVVHMPDDGPVQVYEFDIAAGMEAARLCFGAMAWRKQAALCWPLGARSEDGRQPVAGAGPAGPDEDQRPDSPGMVDVVQRHVPPQAGPGLDPAPKKTVERDEDVNPSDQGDRSVDNGRKHPELEAGAKPPDERRDRRSAERRVPQPGRHGVDLIPVREAEPLDPAALLADIEALPPDVYDALKRTWPPGVPGPKKLNIPTIDAPCPWHGPFEPDVDPRAGQDFDWPRGRACTCPQWAAAVAAAVQQAKDACLYATPAETAERIEEGRRELIERSRRSNDARDGQPVAGAGQERPTGDEGNDQTGVRSVESGSCEEDRPADPAAIQALTRNLAGLTAPQQNIIKDWLAQAKAAGVFFGNLKQNPTIRRFALARACWALVAHMDGDDELVRLALAFVAGDDAVQPAFPTGAIIGALTPSEADLVYEVCTRYKAGELKVGFSATPPYPGRLEAVA